ncbi:sulfite exporter TauE/SafE family protein, partial [bacterium]|nr:sulfite exporter TauE/SafE family protein [bacterium]
MLDFQDLYITLAGILIGYISSITGGLGLMAVPLLVHFGLTPQIAVTTSKFGALGMVIGSLLRFSKTNNINHELVPKLVLIQFLGTLLGAYIFVQLPQGPWMKTAVAGLTLMLLPVTFLRNPKQDSETATQDKSQIGYFLYFLISIYLGIYGAGAGPLVFMTFVHCFGLSLIAANA